MTPLAPHPFIARLPPAVAGVLRPVLPSLSEEIIAAIRDGIDDYAQPLHSAFGQAVRSGTERALHRLLDLVVDPESEDDVGRRAYVELGRGEFRAGRSLDALLAAYRIGARLAWRRFVEAGTAGGLEPDVLYRLGEAIFAYIDELSAESIEGYTAAQSEAAGERQRDRRRLIELLTQQPPAEDELVGTAAEQAGFKLPASLAALTCSDPHPDALASRLGLDVVAARLDEVTIALIPDPDAPLRLASVRRAIGKELAALGPSVPWRDTATSIARARLTQRLAQQGVLEGPFVIAQQHLPTLLLHADPRIAGDLATALLRPLEALPGKSGAKLRRTLRAWLDHQGRVETVAHALEVHPQTVRYRLGQLREAFGDSLDDPDQRFALALALRARHTSGRSG